MSKWIHLIIFLLIIGFGKGHHTIRLVILAALGLAGLWMLHTLAQDFDKIFHNLQNEHHPISKFLSKRSVNATNYTTLEKLPVDLPPIDWERILTRDPVGCARSFVCQLVATKPEELPPEESSILFFIQATTQKDNWASKQLQSALKYGQKTTSPNQCRNRYRFCPYSSKMMMTLLRILGTT